MIWRVKRIDDFEGWVLKDVKYEINISDIELKLNVFEYDFNVVKNIIVWL